jgi:ribonucleotide reductase beta subunit family protein with ferritin-like domain
MDASLFSGFTTVYEMESSRSVIQSPVFTAKSVSSATITAIPALEPVTVEDTFVEPILKENPTRFTLFPIMKPKLYKKYKDHVSVFWTTEEIDLAKDLKDWVKLTANEQNFIKNILAFFAGSDGIVQENLASRFMTEIQLAEARQFYSVQLMMEAIHCVSPDTLILTDKGYFNIKSLVEQKVNVWNGDEFSEVTVKKTSDSSRLYKVLLDNGMELDCTDEHKWLIRTGNSAHPERCKIEKIFTKNLKNGDIVGNFDYPVIDISDPDEFMNPYTHGFFCGDGTYTNKYPTVTLYDLSKKALLSHLVTSSYSMNNKHGKIICYLTNKINKDKYFAPLNYSIKTKLEWLAGLFDADACINESQKSHTSVQYTSINYEFIKKVQLILSTLGVYSNLKMARDHSTKLLPDGLGGEKEYECQPVYCLYITAYYINKLQNIGFSPKRLNLHATDDIIQNRQLIRIVSVIDTQINSETYCFNEPKKHTGIFNGILTGQSETYSLLIDTYIEDKQEKLHLFQAIQTIPCIKLKAEWAQRWIESREENFATRLIAFAVVEGIFFSGSFCAIYWLKERGVMPGLTTSNEFIARDEGLHTDFACALYEEIEKKLPKAKVHKIIREAVKIEKQFITESLPCSMIGMNSGLMTSYIEFVADRLSSQLGYGKLYHTANPFDFMERISLEGKDNFFEKRVTSYAKSGVGKTNTEMSFSLEADF